MSLVRKDEIGRFQILSEKTFLSNRAKEDYIMWTFLSNLYLLLLNYH